MLYFVRKPTAKEITEYSNHRHLFAVYVEEPDSDEVAQGTLSESLTLPIYLSSILQNAYMPNMEGARLYAYDNLARPFSGICLARDIEIR